MNPQQSARPSEPFDASRWIPLFPLPNAVLLPKAVLPLHIFEQRYRIMTADALSGTRLIAMSLLQPEYESNYYTLSAAIHSVVCVGQILRDERLPDGRFNILLQGVARGRVIEENRELRYRRAKIEWLASPTVSMELEYAYRHEIRSMLSRGAIAELAERAGWLDLLDCSSFAFSDLLDALASVVLQCVDDKQAFLSEPDIGRRAKRLYAIISVMDGALREHTATPKRPRSWPPVITAN